MQSPTTPARKQRKDRIEAEVFDMITWKDIEAALKGTRKMFKMWYTKQEPGFCRVGY